MEVCRDPKMFTFASLCFALFACRAVGAPWASSPSYNSWNLKDLKSFVVFGDSYTDEDRLGYFNSHNGSAPPVGYVGPVVSLSVVLF